RCVPPLCTLLRVSIAYISVVSSILSAFFLFFFFFTDTATTEIYTLSLHDALPIWRRLALTARGWRQRFPRRRHWRRGGQPQLGQDRKSTRLNSSHRTISYAVFCLKKKKHNQQPRERRGI